MKKLIPLTKTQEMMLAAAVSDNKNYVTSLHYHIKDEFQNLSFDDLKTRFNILLLRHEILRTTLVIADGTPFMNVSQKPCAEIINVEFFPDEHFAIDPLKDEILIKIYVCKSELLFVFTHILLDGWSVNLILDELFAKEPPQGSAPPFRYYNKWLKTRKITDVKSVNSEQACLPFFEKSSEYNRRELNFSLENSGLIRKTSSALGVPVGRFIETAWGILSSRYADGETFIASVDSGRFAPIPRITSIAGMFVSTIPLSIKIRKNENFSDFVKRFFSETSTAIKSGLSPLTGKLNSLISIEFPESQNSAVTLIRSDARLVTEFDFVVVLSENINCRFEYNACCFSENAVKIIKNHFLNLLQAAIKNPDIIIDEIDFLTDTEKDFLQKDNYDKSLLNASLISIPEHFKKIAALYPNKIAIVFNGKSISYSEIDKLSDNIAYSLLKLNIHGAVLINLPRSFEYIIAEIGIMKASCYFIPTETELPAQKYNEVLRTVAPKFIVSEENYADLTAPKTPIKLPQIDPQSPAYVIMTSGTTGKPKGVMVSHSSISHYLSWAKKTYDFSEKTKTVLIYGFTFDGGFASIYGPILSGGTLHILDKNTRFDIEKIADYISQNEVTHIDLPAAMLPEFTKLISVFPQKYCLKNIVTGGEQVKPFSECGIPVSNEYGPTECTVCVTQTFLSASKKINIGNEIPNTKIHILDSKKRLSPIGIFGECYVSGIQVAIGYICDDDNSAFSDNPRLYKTGDRMRYIEDENGYVLEFGGRIDGQVKLNGFRIELGEIEEAARKFCGIEKSVAVLRDSYIALYAVCENSERIFEKLREILPRYMQPVVVKVPSIPLTESGKPDILRLFEYKAESIKSVEKNEMSTDSKMLCDLIFDIMGIMVSDSDNFIAVGGNSITAMKISFALSERGISLSPADIIASKKLSELVCKMTKREIKQSVSASFTLPNSLKAMVYLSEKYGCKLYTISAVKRCTASREELEKRIKRAVSLHDILRCKFSLNSLNELSAQITDKANIRLINDDEDLPEKINPLDDTLAFVSLKDEKLSLRAHHIILDGYSVELLLTKIADGIFPETAPSFASFADSFLTASDEDFYENSLVEAEQVSLFDINNAPEKLCGIRYFEDYFSEVISAAAKEFSVTNAVFIMTAFGVFLTAYGNAEKTFIPVVASYRNSANLLGSASQTFPVSFEKGNDFSGTAKALQQMLGDTVKHINIPEKYLNLPYIFVDDTKINSLNDSQNYGLVITSGGRILYDKNSVSDEFINTLKTRLYNALKNAVNNKISVFSDDEFDVITNEFSIGKLSSNLIDYLELINDEKAFQIRDSLKKIGIGEGDIVAIKAARDENYLSAYAGVALVGAAFLPIDLSTPRDRENEIFDDCKPSAIIKNGKIEVFENKKKTAPDTAYIIYTSGTTGKPKGVPITKSALKSQISWGISEFGFCKEDVFLHYVNFAFDPSVWVIFSAFAVDAKLKTAHENIRISPLLTARFIEENRITIAVLPSAAAYDILDNLGENSLRIIFLGGDRINIPKRTKFTENIEIINLYGPTETCINASFFRLPKETTATSCIGRPIDGTNIFILDKNHTPSPIGFRGEIYIGGDKLSSGYINRNIETENVFLNISNFGRLYKTGDFGLWNTDGTIEFLGRCDRQVKIRGFRVELSEIEAIISEITHLPSAVIYEKGNLISFALGDFSEDEILTKLRDKLPKYMVPNRIIKMTELPLNRNGKLNYNALKIPTEDTGCDNLSEPERQIAKAFEELLSLPAGTVGKDSDFFALGGHSLKLFSLTGTLSSYGISVNINDIIKYPTPSKLSEIALLADEKLNAKTKNTYADESYSDYILRCKTVDISKKRKSDIVMITGATGFLGAHLLSEILNEMRAKIYIPVRGDNPELRIKEVLRYYFPNEEFDFARLHIFTHDVTKTFPEISEKIDIIYHSAADIRHYAPYDESFSANVTTTENVIDFAKKCGAYLAHISTGSAINHPVITENNFDNGSDFENVYQRTKQQAERIVINNKDIEFGVFRVGNITPSLKYKIHAKNSDTNAYLNLLKLLLKSRTLPDFRGRSGYCFADRTAKAIALLSSREIFDRAIYHVTNPNILTFKNVFEILGVMPDGDHENIPEELRGIYAQRTVEKKSDVSSDIKNTATISLLSRLGFEWETPDIDYLKEFIGYE
jgi:amino acid adenylation domain-containing protein